MAAVLKYPCDALYSRVEALLGVADIRSDDDMAFLVENRLPVGVVAALVEHGLGTDEVYSLILPQRTLSHRRAKSEPLTAEESDRAMRIARILALADAVFGDHDKALRWLRKPKARFSGRSPVSMLATEAGARLVEELLLQIDYGMAA